MAKLIKCKDCGEEISKKAKTCPKCGAPVPKKVSFLAAAIIIIVIIFVVISVSNGNKEQSDILQNVKLTYSVNKAGFGTVLEGNFTVTNNNDYAIKDFEVTCTHYASSGTKIDSNSRDIYEIVPAKSKKTINKFNMGFINSQIQISKTECRIDSAKKAN